MTTKRSLRAPAIVAAALGAAIAMAPLVVGCSTDQHPPAAPVVSSTTTAPAVEIAVDFPTDLSDPRRLAGYASQISVVTVESIRPGEERFDTPWTVADVRIVLNLKGDQQGTIPVSQQGGRRESTGTLVRISGDTLLAPGHSYLLSTTGTPGRNQTVIPAHGITPLTADDLEELKTTGDTPGGEVSDMRRAIANQIPFRR